MNSLIESADVYHDRQSRCFEDVSKKCISQPFSSCCTFNESWNVDDGEWLLSSFNNSNIGSNSREMIFCNLWFDVTDWCDQWWLSDRWSTHQCDICNKLHFDSKWSFFLWLTLESYCRKLFSCMDEVFISRSSSSSFCYANTLSVNRKFRKTILWAIIINYRSYWNAYCDVFSVLSKLVFWSSVLSVSRFENFICPEWHEGILMMGCLDENASPISPVSSRRSSERNVFLSSSCRRSVPSPSRWNRDANFIIKLHCAAVLVY